MKYTPTITVSTLKRLTMLADDRATAYTNGNAPNPFVAMSDELPARYNACNEACDMLVGHCVCGATHRAEDLDTLFTVTDEPTGTYA